MDAKSKILNLETLFPSEIKDVQNHLNDMYETSCANSLNINRLEQTTNFNYPTSYAIKTEPIFMQTSNEDIGIQNHIDRSSFEINKMKPNIIHVKSINPSHSSSISTDQMNSLNRDPCWNSLIQTKINVPLNSNEGQTELMLMILKTLNDNKIHISNISKRLEKLENFFQLESLPVDTDIVIPNHNEIPIQRSNVNSSSKIVALPNQNLPLSNAFITPMENDFHFHQFENNITSVSFQPSVIQYLRQKIGGSLRETVRRMIFALITPEFSLKFNRTGANNKYAFKMKLEPLIKEAVIGIFNCSEKEVEIAIVRTLKETKDKFGSRKK